MTSIMKKQKSYLTFFLLLLTESLHCLLVRSASLLQISRMATSQLFAFLFAVDEFAANHIDIIGAVSL